MKKNILFIVMLCLVSAVRVSAQYSDASLNGTWIADGKGMSFISFNGSGTIIMVGTSDDSLQPVGTYSVTSSGAVSATLNFVEGIQNVTGQMTTDSSADMTATGSNAIHLFEVKSPGVLAGTWSGFIYDSNATYTRNVQLTVSNMGMISSATGLSLTSGFMFAAKDSFATYMTTMGDSCAFSYLQFGGVYTGDSLIGIGNMGAHNSNCQSGGRMVLVRTSTGIAGIDAIDFSVYPNPFTSQVEIAMSHTDGDMTADVYDLCGMRVYSRSLDIATDSSIDLSLLARGTYLLTLTAQDGKTTTKRIVKD